MQSVIATPARKVGRVRMIAAGAAVLLMLTAAACLLADSTESAAYGEDFTAVVLPSTLTSIGWGAFAGCTRLTALTLPDGVTDVGTEFIHGCTSLRTLTLGTGFADTDYYPWTFDGLALYAADGTTGLPLSADAVAGQTYTSADGAKFTVSTGQPDDSGTLTAIAAVALAALAIGAAVDVMLWRRR